MESETKTNGKFRLFMIIGSTALAVALVVFVVLAIIIPIAIWMGVSSYAYDEIFLAGKARNSCVQEGVVDLDSLIPYSDCADCMIYNKSINLTAMYPVPDLKDPERVMHVQFPPRQDRKWQKAKMPNLRAWIWSYDNFTYTAPTIIHVHGIRSCKSTCSAVLTMSMLHRSGFNVLALDLRNHGQSPSLDPPYVSFGNTEFRDVLGAVDYLNQTFGEKAVDRLGIHGISMGGAVSLTAFLMEPAFKALFIDSGATDVAATLRDNIALVMKTTTSVMYGMCVLRGRKYGCAPFENDPLKFLHLANQRPIHFDHCVSDSLVPVSVSDSTMSKLDKYYDNKTLITHFYDETGWPKEVCRDHVILMLNDPPAYAKRMQEFFGQYL